MGASELWQKTQQDKWFPRKLPRPLFGETWCNGEYLPCCSPSAWLEGSCRPFKWIFFLALSEESL